jgi:hypothetical protein
MQAYNLLIIEFGLQNSAYLVHCFFLQFSSANQVGSTQVKHTAGGIATNIFELVEDPSVYLICKFIKVYISFILLLSL